MPLKISEKTRDEYFGSIEKVYDVIPDTTCQRNNTCCNSGCPPMYFSEFLHILGYIKDVVKKEELEDIAVKCMRNYFSDNIIKECPLFVNEKCMIYQARPANCRLYGQIPEAIYEQRQSRPSDEFTMSAEEMREGLDLENVEDIPLYYQCPNVTPIAGTGEEITEESYDNIFRILDEIEGDFLDEIELKINLTSYKTFHDHYLWFTLGEALLEQWTILKKHIGTDRVLLTDVLGKMEVELRKNSKVITIEF